MSMPPEDIYSSVSSLFAENRIILTRDDVRREAINTVNLSKVVVKIR